MIAFRALRATRWKMATLPAFPKNILAAALAFAMLGAANLRAYDSPDFAKHPFSADGIFLEENQRDSILSALTALAANFTGSAKVDSDLKEKALAVALTLDPMNFNARRTHEALARNDAPDRTPYFDTLSAVSESLWTGAERLLEAPVEPENAKLAAYLLEISLLTHPQPPEERLVAFAELTRKKELPWKEFLSLQPGENESSRRSSDMILNLANLDISQRKPKPRKTSTEPEFFAATDEPMAKPVANTDFEPVTKSIACVIYAEAVDGKPMAGKLTLEARPPADASETPSGDSLPLIPKRADGIMFGGLEKTSSVPETRGWEWPAGVVGALDFETEDAPPGPPRVTTAEVFLPGMILAESAIKGLEINEDTVLGGDFEAIDATPVNRAELLSTIEAAARLDKPYLALPVTDYEKLVAYLRETEQLGVLFATELLAYSGFDDATMMMTRPTPDSLSEASRAFSEIEAVSTRMSFVDLARNAKVQERLESILASYPGHMSAKAMLAFGREEPVTTSETMSSVPDGESVIEKIDAAIKPFLQLDGSSYDINELRNAIEDSQITISRLRTEMTLEHRDYHSAAEDLLEAAELYIGLTNQTTSTAEQRLRETRQAIAELETERRVLGLGEFE